MQRQRRRDTEPELVLRRMLYGMGLRYRVDKKLLPGTRRRGDIVFGPARVAVFVQGCFWHSCPEHGTTPKANGEWWRAKLARNAERDAETRRFLETVDWQVMEVWEHDDPDEAAKRIASLVRHRRNG